jgi:hypothetical protein
MKTPIKLNESRVRKLLDVVDAGLGVGVGKPTPGAMCVESAVSFAFGFKYGDNPKCVGPLVREAMISLNDSAWTTTQSRANGLRRAAIAQLGSDTIDQELFCKQLVGKTPSAIIPLASCGDKNWLRRSIQGTVDAVYWLQKDYNEAAWACVDAADAAAKGSEFPDTILSAFADLIVSILSDMDCPGCKWLFLAEPSATKL